MKHIRIYKIDLNRIQGDGDLLCPSCGVTISPEDETEEVYTILEPIAKDNMLEGVVIQCNSCASRIQVTGFSKLYSI